MNLENTINNFSPLKAECFNKYLNTIKDIGNQRSGSDNDGPLCKDIYSYLFTPEEKDALIQAIINCLDER